MKLIGLMPVRNEDWLLGLSARVALQWCDALVILLHACTDRSEEIAHDLAVEHPDRLCIVARESAEWHEMKDRQALLEIARSHEIGATHIAMIDADEVLTANFTPNLTAGCEIRSYIQGLAPGQMLELPGYNLRGSLDRYHSNGIWGNRWFSLAFKDTPAAHWGGDRFHSRAPAGVKWQTWRPIQQGEGGVMHLWGASERRLRAKSALYKVTERLRWPDKPVAEIDKMYSWAIKGEPGHPSFGTPETWTYAQVPRAWTEFECSLRGWRIDAEGEPWQEAEVRRLVAEHGREHFAGLDLFGLL